MAALSVEFLPAARGDCIWIECARPAGPPFRLLVDGGMPSSWPQLRRRVAELAAAGPVVFDLVVVSHIDSDHIGGLLPLLASTELDIRFKDVWFNGLTHLPEAAADRPRSVAEGERMVELLGNGDSRVPWNEQFGRAAVVTRGDGAFDTIAFSGGPTLTLLSPTPRRLASLRKTWSRELLRLQRGEADGVEDIAVELPLEDLEALGALESTRDQSPANGSSIAFIVEHQGRSCLLAADAFSSVLGTALQALANSRDGKPVDVDVFKLPHHASKANVTSHLVKVAPARHYVVSTNGDRFHHPDDVALARVVTSARELSINPTIWFN